MNAFSEHTGRLIAIRLYERDGSAAGGERRLVRTLRIPAAGSKALTAKRAAQVLVRALPQFGGHTGPRILRTKSGWQASRTLRPTPGCSFHFIWEEAVITEEAEQHATPQVST